jgi:sulfate permease, SulP family
MGAIAGQPTFFELYTPKLVTVLRETYGMRDLRADAISGLTVAIVALPLSMAIAIASGVTPDRGLITAIVGGFLVSLLGGSRFQIGGPAGAFIVLVLATVQTHGVDGLILATLMAGVFLVTAGLLRFGTYIKYIPYPVTVGFTGGIAVIIFASQVKDLLGLRLSGAEPGALWPKLEALAAASGTINPSALALSVLAIVVIGLVRAWRPHWPGLLIAVALVTVIAWALHLPVETIGSRFGGIPRGLPAPRLPDLSLDKLMTVLPAALSFTLLGSIESLLSAVVADSMTGRRHRSNCELVAQGTANIASALFGGICVTGTIARTATNVRSGARGPVSGMLHALFLLVFMLIAAPLASYIPLAALAGVLATVAWSMAERHAFATLLRASRGDALVVLATFLLTVFRDLTEGIVAGFSISALLFLHRMAQAIDVESVAALEDRADAVGDDQRAPYDAGLATDPDVAVCRISGAFFFGAAASVGAALDQIAAHPRAYVIDLTAVPILDSSAATTLAGFVRKAERRGSRVYVSGARQAVRHTLLVHGVKQPQVRYMASISAAVELAHANLRADPQPVD